jgi:hypothetical protein
MVVSAKSCYFNFSGGNKFAFDLKQKPIFLRNFVALSLSLAAFDCLIF